MMPDLGAYATEVALAYILSLATLTLMILWIWIRSRRVKRDLADLETRMNRKSHG
jgi:heme exporter protein CcmD|tara:strand:+ start:6913 stop:7077 length:165 start_codon:yes stop_codon:yes gene_type:complete